MPITSDSSLRYVLRPLVVAFLSVLVASAVCAQFVISEFRLRGPNGASDEYIEIQNNSAAPVTVASVTGTGLGIAASDGVLRCTIPNGTVIPARGHFLCANSAGYSLAAYPAGNGTTATGNATFTTDIADGLGIALFDTNLPANFNLANRLDAVGPVAEANTLYKEGSGYPTLTPLNINSAFVRDLCGKQGSIFTPGTCPNGGFLVDSNNNATDFYFVDTNGTFAGAGQRLGAPGPKNLSSPTFGASSITSAPVDTCSGATAPPNIVRDFTSVPANNSTFGTLDIRGTFTNSTGANLTTLRFRIIDLTTFPAPAGFADLRPLTSSDLVVTVDRPPCGTGTSNITVRGTTLEQPPSQPNGGGFNSTLSVGSIQMGTPLPNGAAVDVRFLLGIQQTGNYRLGVITEALPEGGGTLVEFSGNTDTTPPPVTSKLVISEFRLRGPNGASDEYIEIQNNSAAPVTVASVTGTGLGIAASDGVLRCTIPNGTVIPARGHFLCENSVGYSLAAYPAGSGTTATGNATFTTDIADVLGIALFDTNLPANFNLANRLDAVGPVAEANTLYKEGSGYPTLTPFSINSAFVRDLCGKQGSILTPGTCPNGGFLVDSNNNATDFYFVDTNGTSAGAGQRLGAPGPKNLSSPTFGASSITSAPIDTCFGATISPNIVRDFTSVPASNSTFGTLDIRRTFTNSTGANLTTLRFRIIDLTTFPAPSGIADLRPLTSADLTVNVDRPPCGTGTSNITVRGTTLEQPPSQPNGGGFNSTLSVGSIQLGTPLPNGAAVDVRFLLGIQQTGNYRLGVITEALPEGGSAAVEFSGNTDIPQPTITSIFPNGGPIAGGQSVTITGTFLTSATVTIGGISAVVTGTTATTATFNTPAHAAGAVDVTATTGGGSATSTGGYTYLVGAPAPPTGVTATAVSPTAVTVSWSAAVGALSYEIYRRGPGSAFTLLGTAAASPFSDSTALADTAYLYRMRSVNAAGSSGDSVADIATTVIFPDDPLLAGTTIKIVHLSGLRTAVNAVRALAGLGAASFTDSPLAGLLVKAVHITELRAALDPARTALGLSSGGYTDAALTGIVVKAIHFQEIRNRVK